ncbi:MAG: acyltransferase family protein [bacterium]
MPVSPKDRLLSLDVFRGVTIAGMVLVNNPGSWSHVYPPLRHAEWHGWTPTDLVFPFFLFIVGVAMAYSFGKILQTGEKPKGTYWKIVRRMLILFGLGLFLYLIPTDIPAGYNWFSDTLAKVRIMGVLQRIAVVYFFASLIVLHFKPRSQAYWAIGLLAFYWIVMKLVPVPVNQDGVMTTYVGSLGKDINLAAYFDTLVLHGHTWRVGKYFDYDPEGILSTIPAIATALIGVFTGNWLRQAKPQHETVSGLFFAGVGGLLIGSILNGWFPINKPLWSPSYVLFMAGMALIFLAMCYYLIEIKGYTKWIKPFVIFGMNPIALYVLAEATVRLISLIKVTADRISLQGWIYENIFVPVFGNLNGSLGYALAYVSFWLGIMTIFYKKKIFIKI